MTGKMIYSDLGLGSEKPRATTQILFPPLLFVQYYTYAACSSGNQVLTAIFYVCVRCQKEVDVKLVPPRRCFAIRLTEKMVMFV